MAEDYTQNSTASWGLSTQLIDLGDGGPENNTTSNSINTHDTLLELSPSSTHPHSYTDQLLMNMSPMSAAPVPRTGSIPLIDALSPSVAVVGETAPAATATKGIAIGNTDFFDFFETGAGQSPSAGGVLAGSFSNPFTSSYGLDMAAQAVPIVQATSPEPPQMQDLLSLLEGKAGSVPPSPVKTSLFSTMQQQQPVMGAASGGDDGVLLFPTPERSHLTQEEKCDLEQLKSYLLAFKTNSDKNAHYLKSKSKL